MSPSKFFSAQLSIRTRRTIFNFKYLRESEIELGKKLFTQKSLFPISLSVHRQNVEVTNAEWTKRRMGHNAEYQNVE